MNKKITRIIQLFEYFLYTTFFIVVAQGVIDDMVYQSPAAGIAFLVGATLIFVAFPIIQTKQPKFLTKGRTVLLTALFVILSIHVGISPFPEGTTFTFSYFFVIFALIFATTGAVRAWLPAIALLLIWTFVDKSTALVSPSTITAISIPISFIVFIFSWIQKHNVETEYHELLKEEILKQKVSTASSQPTATQENLEAPVVQAENMVSTGKELDNLIYFIDTMYKPHSACAFVYDKANDRFILTSAKSRSGMIRKNTIIPGGKGQGIIGELTLEAKTFSSGDLALYNRDLGYYSGNVLVSSVLVVPILSRDHGLLGALAMDSTEKLAYRDEHRDRLSRFARIAAELIGNVIMRKRQEQDAARFSMFYKSALKFTQGHLKMDEVLDSVITFIGELDDISRVTAVAYSKKSNQCRVLAVQGDTNEVNVGYSFVSAPGSIFNSAVTNNKVEFVSDFRQIRTKAQLYVQGEVLNPNISSIMVVPFGVDTTEYEIVMVVESNKIGYFSTEMRHTITTIIRNGASAYEKAFLYQKMEIQATTDGLTGLCNHRNFQDNLHQSILASERYGRPLSLLLMDIDKFKVFNDTYGHQIGDLVLKIISKALTGSVRQTDLPARYGGEEFVVVLPETDEINSLRMAERIRSTIEQTPIETENHGVLSVTVSIGSATRGAEAMTQEQLIQSADAAMYQSKKTGRNRVTAYLPGMENEIDT